MVWYGKVWYGISTSNTHWYVYRGQEGPRILRELFVLVERDEREGHGVRGEVRPLLAFQLLAGQLQCGELRVGVGKLDPIPHPHGADGVMVGLPTLWHTRPHKCCKLTSMKSVVCMASR
jgi:hypothetical protein